MQHVNVSDKTKVRVTAMLKHFVITCQLLTTQKFKYDSIVKRFTLELRSVYTLHFESAELAQCFAFP